MEEIRIILDIVLLIFGLIIIFGKSYFKEKGKNLATKEDIGKITSIIEEVKSNFSKDIELLKIHQSKILDKRIEIFNTFMTLLVKVKNIEDISSDEDVEFQKLKYLIFLFASDDTILKFKRLVNIRVGEPNVLEIKADLILSMRKDIGYQDTNITIDDLLNILLPNWDKFKFLVKK